MPSSVQRALAIGAFVITATTAAAQAQTLMRDGGSRIGGFGGPAFRVTQAAGETMILGGGGGAVLLNRRLAIGGAGFGGTSRVDTRAIVGTDRGEMDFGYGGLTVEYIVNPTRLVHPTVGILVGGGAVSVWPNDLRPRSGRSEREETFGVVEPQLAMELNVAKWFRMGGAVSYRAVIGAEDVRLRTDELSGASATMFFRFGAF